MKYKREWGLDEKIFTREWEFDKKMKYKRQWGFYKKNIYKGVGV